MYKNELFSPKSSTQHSNLGEHEEEARAEGASQSRGDDAADGGSGGPGDGVEV